MKTDKQAKSRRTRERVTRKGGAGRNRGEEACIHTHSHRCGHTRTQARAPAYTHTCSRKGGERGGVGMGRGTQGERVSPGWPPNLMNNQVFCPSLSWTSRCLWLSIGSGLKTTDQSPRRVMFESGPARVAPLDRSSVTRSAGAGIMEADDRQVTTVFTAQPSFHHRHTTNRVL